uniref:C6 domain-containing protein n=1 Tax=Acrobeloides nanus TaxID=290746 RepID=A0A914CY84_9BILA
MKTLFITLLATLFVEIVSGANSRSQAGVFVEILADAFSESQISNNDSQSAPIGGFQGVPNGFPWGIQGIFDQIFGKHGHRHHRRHGNESSSENGSSEEGSVNKTYCSTCNTDINTSHGSFPIIQTLSYDYNGCSNLTLNCTSPYGGMVYLQWFNGGQLVAIEPSFGEVNISITCNENHSYYFGKAVDTVNCTDFET